MMNKTEVRPRFGLADAEGKNNALRDLRQNPPSDPVLLALDVPCSKIGLAGAAGNTVVTKFAQLNVMLDLSPNQLNPV